MMKTIIFSVIRKYLSLSLIIAIFVTFTTMVNAQDAEPGTASPLDVIELVVENGKDEKRGSDLIILPIPMSSPTYGTGLGVGAALLYDLDASSKASYTAAGAFKTSNGSKGAGILQSVNFGNDRFKAKLALALAELNYDFYGVGNDAGNRNIAVPVKEHKFVFGTEFSVRLSDNIYLGAKYKIAKSETTVRSEFFDAPISANASVPERLDRKLTTGAFGGIVQFDSRDNSFAPRDGWLVELNWMFNDPKFGSDFTFDTLNFKANLYTEISSTQVLATRAFFCSVHGDAPYWELCQFGKKSDLRGYPSGSYRDSKLIAIQAEYRWQFHRKFGFIAFVGAGAVADKIRDLDGNDILPSYGVGLRYAVSTKYRVNLSVDYARGRDSEAIYLRVGEAF